MTSHFFIIGAQRCGTAAGRAEQLGGFVRARLRAARGQAAVGSGNRLITGDFKGYAGLAADYAHDPVVQGDGKNAETFMPIVHVLFCTVKTWLNGTFHGVSAKHLPRYAREWNYRFNRRRRINDLADLVLRRAVTRPTITYRQLVDVFNPWAQNLH